jgi:hypothetical protein
MGGVNLSKQVPVVPEPVVWRSQFRTVSELEQGDVRMLIRDFLPEGTVFIGGLPGECKTLFALALAKALTTGDYFMDGKFFVEEQTPVIYLCPESSGRAFRARCEAFEIPDDENWFLCRTVSEGAILPLDSEALFEAVRRLKPVVILDTFVRFNESDDENDAQQNKQIVEAIIKLRQLGAVCVIGLHHSTKSIREKGVSLETVLRGTGDIAASADAVYGLLRDHLLYGNGAGANEVDVYCVKARDFTAPEPFRVAASRKREERDGNIIGKTVSIIDEYHDFRVISENVGKQAKTDRVVGMVESDPSMTLKELQKATGLSIWEIRKALRNAGLKSTGVKGARGSWAKKQPPQPPIVPDVETEAADVIN